MNFEYLETYVLVYFLVKGGGGKTTDTHATATGINRGEAAFNAGSEVRRIKLNRKQFITNLIETEKYSEEEAEKAHKTALREAQRALADKLKNPPQNSIYRPLAIDLNDQASLTHVYGLQKNSLPTAFDVLKGDVPIEKAIVQTPHGYILPGGSNLNFLATTAPDYLTVVKSLRPKIIDKIARFFFPIVIDTSPNQNDVANDIALTAADGVVIPTNAEEFGKEGFVDALEKIERIKALNSTLETLGVLMNRFSEIDIVNQDVIEEMKEAAAKYGTNVFDTYIRECATVRKAQRVKQPIYDFDEVGDTATADYLAFFKELLDKNERLRCPKIIN